MRLSLNLTCRAEESPSSRRARSRATFWEVKSPLDEEALKREEALIDDIEERFEGIPQPYILSIDRVDLSIDDSPRAVKEI